MVIIASRYGGLITLESGKLNFCFYFLEIKKTPLKSYKRRLRIVIHRGFIPGDYECFKCIKNLLDPDGISGSGEKVEAGFE